MTCVYPPHPYAPTQSQNIGNENESDNEYYGRGDSRIGVTLQATPTVFNMTDMRLFHNFMVSAHPHIPLGNEGVWVNDIASYSHAVGFFDFELMGWESLLMG